MIFYITINRIHGGLAQHYVAVIERLRGVNPAIIRPPRHPGACPADERLTAHEPVRHSAWACSASITLETTSMFKKLIPVIALALIAGPAFAADAPAAAPAADQSAPAKSSHHSKKSSSHHKHSSKSGADSSTAPAK